MRLVKLTKTDEFSSVFSFRKRIYGRWLIANVKPNQLGKHRFGLVVSKKTAKLAVRRNYMKRVLRMLLQNGDAVVQPSESGCDVVVQVKQAFLNPDYSQVQDEVRYLLKKIRQYTQPVSRT